MRGAVKEFLDMELLSRLPTLELKARFIVDGFLAGLHRSPLKGGSPEFMEYREYQQGDDPRQIDWKTYARTDRLHVRLREEETNMRVTILLDKSSSMEYRSRPGLMTKWDYARSLAAALLLFLHRQRDAAELGFAGDGLESLTNGGGSRLSRLHTLTSMLDIPADSRKSDVAGAVDELSGRVRKRSIVIVISDFYESPERLSEAIGKLRHGRCEPLLFQALDPAERDLRLGGLGVFEEMESLDRMPVSPDLIRAKYKEAVDRHIERLADVARSSGGDFLSLGTDMPPLMALGAYMSKRKEW